MQKHKHNTEMQLMNDDKTPETDEKPEGSALDNANSPIDENQAHQSEADEHNESDDNAPTSKTDNFISTLTNGPLLTNIILAGLFGNFIMIYYNDYNTTPKFSTLLMMIQVSCIALFFLIRVAPSKVSMDPKDWIIAVLGTALPMLIFPVENAIESHALLLLQLIGIFISIIAILSLNNSFGIVPAVRNIKTKGLYSLIRHPIYFGYFIFITCIVLQNISAMNVVILVAIYAADIYRILAEENILSEDHGYQTYKSRVKWRLIPFVW